MEIADGKISPEGCKIFWEYFMSYMWVEYRKGNVTDKELRNILDPYKESCIIVNRRE